MKKFLFERILERYEPDFAVAYGSGVFSQNGYTRDDRPMIDFIFGVSDPLQWHAKNIAQNPKDYSATTRFLNAKSLAKIQDFGPGLFYNPFVKFENITIKYSIVSLEKISKDLSEWNTLYIAGRLHKPVLTLKSTAEIEKMRPKNLEHALNVATMLLPQNFSARDLFMQITEISYLGDARTGIAENSRKVANIVDKNQNLFKQLYREAITNADWLTRIDEEKFTQDLSEKTLIERSSSLPPYIKLNILTKIPSERIEKLRPAIIKAIKSITFYPSVVQSAKGILTAGPFNSVRYLAAKLKKAYRN